MASPPGTKGDTGGDLAVGDVLASLARALGHRAAAQGAGIAEDAAGAELGLGSVRGHEVSIALEILIHSFGLPQQEDTVTCYTG